MTEEKKVKTVVKKQTKEPVLKKPSVGKKTARVKKVKAVKAPEPVMLKSGFASIVGRPNSGKSTLLNYIVGEKVSIVSDVPQTTRQMLRGIYTDERGQIVFIDTPGWHIGRDQLDRYMNKSCVNAIEGVDCIIYLADTSRRVGDEENRIVERLRHVTIPIVMGLNKIDLKRDFLGDYIALWERVRGRPVSEEKNFVMIPLSGREGTQVDALVEAVYKFLPAGPFHYEADIVTDTPRRQVVADIIREKLFILTREELPHAIAVVIEEMRPSKGKTTYIRAAILVERATQKEIVIGHKGAVLKEAGSLARQELEVMLETKVFLDLFVKTRDKWRDSADILADMGYAFDYIA